MEADSTGLVLLAVWAIGVAVASALLHECGHACAARAVGWKVVALRWRWYAITLAAEPNERGDEVWKVALGGLCATALLALGFLAGSVLSGPAELDTLCRVGFAVNALMLLTNLLPLPPLDGGLVLTGLREVQSAARAPRSADAQPAPAVRGGAGN